MRAQIFEAGIIGAGGAGFPTHIKLAKGMAYLIINGAECEPLMYTDYEIMMQFSEELVTIIRDMLNALGLKKAIWGIKSKHKALIAQLNTITSLDDAIEICPLPNIYPAGDELTLIYKCANIIIPKGQLPSQKKVIALNVETLYNIYKCIYEKQPVTDKYITVTGAVEEPKVIKAAIGTTFEEIIKHVTVTIPEYDILLGGPMMGSFVSADIKVTKTTKAIILLPKDTVLYHKKKAIGIGSIKRVMSACSQCQMCTDLCPRNRLGHKVEPHKLMNAFANGLVQNSDKLHTALGCCGCNTCSYYACHHDLSPAELMMMVKRELMKEGIKPSGEEYPRPSHNVTAEIPSSRLLDKLGLKQYDKPAMFKAQKIIPRIVYMPIAAHIGKPASPIVNVGDYVRTAQKIASGDLTGISANIHSSINGVVKKITQTEIIIEGR
ncbi:4Fe-4S dicluster domain-containing protein [Cellulosilyticum sp. I15G10I2]|uniref:4Fe-4S dicluster domain-containing protein n=1 Tax=Cellulosilyticum sp. I15G10I2 TaxID=1892843 RepID=UPI00085C72B6|nr:4Fe-4S dicluster domain-containing protein [Cellulosilyticum sp. I15G10I2]